LRSTPQFATGGLIVYALELAALLRRTGDYVDKILKGTKPANQPVEQPTKFELIINMKTARCSVSRCRTRHLFAPTPPKSAYGARLRHAGGPQKVCLSTKSGSGPRKFKPTLIGPNSTQKTLPQNGGLD
jgi:hypothetical protein